MSRGTALLRVLGAVALIGAGLLTVRAQDGPPATPAAAPPTAEEWEEVGLQFIANHCLQCHRGEKAKGKFRIDALAPDAGPVRNPMAWRAIREMLATRAMPPKRVTPPSAEEYDAMVSLIDRQLQAWRPTGPVDPGRVTLRRLNRAEYTNTIRDLLGVTFHADATFPVDDVGNGFDNQGDVLSVPPILLEKYLGAAERIAALAIRDRDGDTPARDRVIGPELKRSGKGGNQGSVSLLYTNGDWSARFTMPRTGEYVVQVRAFGQQAGPDACRGEFRLDGERLSTVEVTAVAAAPGLYEARFRTTPGRHTLAFAFTNDFYNPKDPDPKNRDRNMGCYHLELIGPVDPQVLPDSHTRWLGAGTDRPLATAVAALAQRAFRRPVSTTDVARLCTLARSAAGADAPVERQFRVALTAVLVSPHFLFRVERHPAPDDARRAIALDDWALASRLSYFLWSSMPDARLFALAEAGTLHEPATLVAEADRMLRDARASALAANFAPQWLQVRALDEASPDPGAFPEFDDALRTAMRLETELFFDAVLREDRPITELLEADFTFVNERLARHYGLPGVRGDHMRRVPLNGVRQGGVLAHGSVLTATSNPTRTSGVRRGKWILQALLDQPTPPPPPGFDSFDSRPANEAGTTLRERLERHRADPKCAICHDRMDTLGFALEPYDGVGRWRTHDGRLAIDARGTLPDGRVVDGPQGLARMLRTDPAFPRSLARHLLTYALGRGLGEADRPAVDACADALAETPTLRHLIRTIVQLDAFRRQRGEARSEGF